MSQGGSRGAPQERDAPPSSTDSRPGWARTRVCCWSRWVAPRVRRDGLTKTALRMGAGKEVVITEEVISIKADPILVFKTESEMAEKHEKKEFGTGGPSK